MTRLRYWIDVAVRAMLCDACDRSRHFVWSTDGRSIVCWRCRVKWTPAGEPRWLWWQLTDDERRFWRWFAGLVAVEMTVGVVLILAVHP